MRVLVRTALLSILLPACLEAHATRCMDLVCPEGLVCAEELERCVRPDQADACAGLDEGDPCTERGPGFCHSGYCLAYTCGDGIRDGAEVCDDGNLLDGDGCSADCRSDESCGNGIVDGRVGEQCDDGNERDGDGCQSTCALATCGDGVVDPIEMCDDSNLERGDGCNPQCTSDETCGNGVIDVYLGEECDDGGLEVGDGCGATCRIEVCGNGIVDPGELCDDGNIVGGDGCSASCRSDETCGNGVADFDAGEQCDDGNFRSHDGCSSRCTAELPIFTERDFDATPSFKYAKMTFDGSHDRLVLVGGVGPLGEPRQDTEVFDGLQWARLDTNRDPPPRRGHVLVYDAARRQVLVVGGLGSERPMPGAPPPMPRPLGDEWVLEGSRWTETTGASTPVLVDSAGAYDAARAEVVVFGGERMGIPTAETWIRGDSGWSRATPTTQPPARRNALMAYDSVRERVVLFGGTGAAGVDLKDTWEWDGSSWTETTPATLPHARDAMAFDAARARVVAFGGSFRQASAALWEYDGTSWLEVTPFDGPEPRWGSSLAYDPSFGVVLRAGTALEPGPPYDDTWIYDGSVWRELALQKAPPPTLAAGGTFDSRERRVMSFGGTEPPPSFAPREALWCYDGRGWDRRSEVVPPEDGDRFTTLVDDEARGRLISVRNGATGLETWAFAHGWWTRLATTGAPPQRDAPVLVYDAARGVVVLFGGRTELGPLADTWELEGETWTERSPPASPPGRASAFAAFDRRRGVTVVFGGEGAARRLGDTWEWDGATWVETTPLPGPSPRSGRGMGWYPPRETILLAGGSGSSEVWEYDGARWLRVEVPQSFVPRAMPIVVTDRERDVLVLAGGDPTPTTWELQYRSEVETERCDGGRDEDGDGLVDCADPDCEAKSCGFGVACLAGACVCRQSVELDCGNGTDDDCDGAIDCADPDCAGGAFCGPEADCADGLDDDGDGPRDCADPGCLAWPGCEPYESSCGDGRDNDGDGRVDCEDPDCFLVSCAQPS